MTEQEINEKILSEEKKFKREYNSLISYAKRVSNAAEVNAKETFSYAESQLRSKRIRNTLLPLLISVAGFIIIKSGLWFLSTLMMIGGIVLAFCLNQKAGKELHDAVFHHQSAKKDIEDQERTLNDIIKDCEKRF